MTDNYESPVSTTKKVVQTANDIVIVYAMAMSIYGLYELSSKVFDNARTRRQERKSRKNK